MVTLQLCVKNFYIKNFVADFSRHKLDFIDKNVIFAFEPPFGGFSGSGGARPGRARSNDLAERLPPWL